jgi:2-dehydro-3-deoxyphosphooctonate aldolase (KDO 8-P synthase)
VQLPGGEGRCTGGERLFIPVLARASLAAGSQGIYAESHPDPSAAKSDAACVIPFSDLPQLVDEWVRIYEATQLCFNESSEKS